VPPPPSAEGDPKLPATPEPIALGDPKAGDEAPEKPEKEPKLLVELVGCDSPKPPPAAVSVAAGAEVLFRDIASSMFPKAVPPLGLGIAAQPSPSPRPPRPPVESLEAFPRLVGAFPKMLVPPGIPVELAGVAVVWPPNMPPPAVLAPKMPPDGGAEETGAALAPKILPDPPSGAVAAAGFALNEEPLENPKLSPPALGSAPDKVGAELPHVNPPPPELPPKLSPSLPPN